MLLSLIKPVRDGHSYHIWEALFGFSDVNSETSMPRDKPGKLNNAYHSNESGPEFLF